MNQALTNDVQVVVAILLDGNCETGSAGAILASKISITGRVMMHRLASKFGFCIAAFAALLVVALADALPLCAQSSQVQQATGAALPLPSFEVVSVKRDTSGGNTIWMGGPDVGSYTASNVTAKMLIEFAYDMKDFQVFAKPSWIDSERFDIDAKVEDSLAEQLQKLTSVQQQRQMRSMVRSLLADRFQLNVTQATKQLPVYALVVAKGGPKLAEAAPTDTQGHPGSTAPAPSPSGRLPAPSPPTMMMEIEAAGEANLIAKAAPIANLVSSLSQLLNREVLDETGLKGTYDFTLKWKSERGFGSVPLPPPGAVAEATPDAGGTSIFTALMEQVGLRLESRTGPVDTITINHIEEPSAN